MNGAITSTLSVFCFHGSLVVDVFMIAGRKTSKYQLGFDVQFGQFALLKGVVRRY